MKKILPLLFVLFSLCAAAQYQKVNFGLRADIQKYQEQDKELSLIVRGNISEIKKEVRLLKGSVGLSSGGFVVVRLLPHLIPNFSENNFVESIEYSISKAHVLNDTLKINNNVPPVNSGAAPLIDSYTGKGVIFGLIDAGIDVNHADFQDSLGRTRILRLWDQVEPDNGTSTYGYGVVWDSTDINNNATNHVENFIFKGHGSHVGGIGAGNGLAVDNYRGVAPDANIIAVSVDFWSGSQTTIIDAVDYIYSVADSLGMPCVLNLSLGDYAGSHDGTNGEAVIIDSLLNFKPGRALVCAAGNAGAFQFHLQHQVNTDTTFTWFKYNAASLLGYGAVFYEIWADTADLNNVDFAVGANLPSGSFGLRGKTPFDNIQNRLGNFTDTIKNNGNIIGIVDTYGELQGDKYLLQIHMQEPDSNTYLFSLMTTGSGKLDVWSHPSLTGTSEIVKTGLPSAAVYPNIVYYQEPDTSQTIVSSFNCLPTVISVGTYLNRKTYLDVDSTIQVTAGNIGQIDVGSSIGPARRGLIKPEIASTGRYVMSTTPDTIASYFIGIGGSMWIGFGGKHMLKNGTSMASPAVAGIVALYLEKCPNATMAEIRAAILGSAKQDAFTGITPNNSYGFGKSDAFAALNTSNYTLSIGSNQNVCDGDSVQINSPAFSSYLWSTNEMTQNISIDTTATVYLTATNNSGCKGLSDTVNVIWRPLPIKPIISVVGNDTLFYATNLNTQWYFNAATLPGETDTIHVAQNTGNYFVQVTDAFGCVNNSDTVPVIILGIEPIVNNGVSIYPNPTNGKLTIELLQGNVINEVALIDLLGQVVVRKSVEINQDNLHIDMGSLANGVYYIRVNSDTEETLQKIILLR
jgi:subtilisin family serine protease